jgi:hypothetical protein
MDTHMHLTSDALGAFARVKEADWTAISRRVGTVVLAEGAVEYIGRYLHQFPKLLAVCKKWRAKTFPGLVDHVWHLESYADQAIDGFAVLSRAVAGMDPRAPVPSSVAAQATKALQDLARSTATLSQEFSRLEVDVREFYTENSLADQEIDAYSAQLGPSWKSIAEPTSAVQNATGLVMGAWQGLCDDLGHLASETITITTPYLLSLDIEGALVSWAALSDEAVAFIEMAAGQDAYMSGQW